MRITLRLSGFAAAALLLLPASLLAQGRTVAGTYTTTITSPQGGVKAVIVLKKTGSAYSGTLAADGFPEIPVSNVVPSDTGVTLQGDSPDGAVLVSMKFAGSDKITGKVTYQGMDMVLDGTFAAVSGAMPVAAVGGMSPVGSYEMKTTGPMMGASVFDVTCAVTKTAAGGFDATCGNPERGDVPASSVTVSGNVVTIGGDTPVGPFRIVMTVAGKAITGSMSVGDEKSDLKGQFTAR